VLDGRKEMYRLLVRRYQDTLFRHAERMVGDGDVAADLVQEALVTGYRKLRRCRDPERVGGWLYRIAANRCRDHLRSPRRDRVSLDRAPDLPSRRGDPEREAERGALRERLEAALDALGPEKREAFLLKHLEGRSYEEMAELSGASVSALKMRVHRAREELRRSLEEEG